MFTRSELSSMPAVLRLKVEEVAGKATLAESLSDRLKTAELRIKLLEEQLRLERIAKYGAASEKLSDGQLELLDAEPGVSPQEIILEAGQPELEKQAVEKIRRPAVRGLGTLPPELPREEEIVPCSEADCVCSCCQGPRKLIGYEVTERLDRVPARYLVKVIKREKRACPACEEGGVATAALPPQIIPKGIATDRVVVDVMLAKYELHQPLYRQQVQMSRESGIELTRQTTCGWIMDCGFLLTAVTRAMLKGLVEGSYIQADETPIGVKTETVKKKNHRGYLWEYSRPGGAVVFDYRDGRGQEGPAEILQSFRGVLQTDGYKAYSKLEKNGMRLAACMAHARRKFYDAAKVYPENKDLLEILQLIQELYAIEAMAREKKLSPEQRLALRQAKSVPIMAELKKKIIALRANSLPKNLTGKASNYALNHWAKLEVYLDQGEVEIDNNWCENAIRPIALGRKNWLHFGSKQAGPNIAAILSVIETCHRLKISARDYLLDVLPKLSNGLAIDAAALTPMAWQAARPSAN